MRSQDSRPPNRGWLFALGLLAALVPQASQAAEESRAFLEISSWTRTQALPLEAFYNNLKTPLDRGHSATTRNLVRVGAQYGAFSLAYVRRYDAEIEMSRDALELIYLSNNAQALPAGRRFDLKIRPWILGAEGLQAGWRFAGDGDSWSLEPRLTILKANDLAEGRLDGTATAVDQNTYEYEAQVDYVYRDDVLLQREVDEPRGYGYSLALAGHWQASPEIRLRWDLRDLYGRVYWNDAPHTVATATSDTRDTDANGFALFRPTLSGIENNIDYRQKLRPAGETQLEYRFTQSSLSQWTALAGLVWTQTDTIATVGARHPVASWLDVSITTTPRVDALGIGLSSAYGSVYWLADRPDFKNLHTLSTQISIAYPF